MIFRNILSFAASIIKMLILFTIISKSIADENINKSYSQDTGILSIMYHRFNEDKYPSTNINMEIFKKHIDLIKSKNLEFYNPAEFTINFNDPKKNKSVLITIDDAYTSFYENAWPYLRENKIPFILFVSTEPVGKFGYMNWDQIREIEKSKFGYIGNHSHSHEYLVKFSFENFKKDINESIKIFEKMLGYNPEFFSYPFGEYSFEQKSFIKANFKNAFGQHSGVIDVNKDIYELPRFPINEKYGELERFSFIVNLNPFEYRKLIIKDTLLTQNENPPKIIVNFFDNQKNLSNLNCFSNEGEGWNKSQIKIIDKILEIKFDEKFNVRRGRINCSLKDDIGWRWFGIQFVFN